MTFNACRHFYVQLVRSLLILFIFSELINEDLLNLLTSKNWKMRNEGLQKVQEIFGDGKPVEGHMTDLTTVLSKMCADSNKNLVKMTLGLCEVFPRSLGRRLAK